MSAEVYQGAVAPEVYQLDITPGSSGIDLSTVSAAVLKVHLPDGTDTTWSVVMSNKTTTTLTLKHTFINTDTAQTGIYVIYASLTISLGTVRTRPSRLLVKVPYAVD